MSQSDHKHGPWTTADIPDQSGRIAVITGLLLDRLLATAGSRIVTVSSLAHRRGTIQFDDLQSERRFHAMEAYDQSN